VGEAIDDDVYDKKEGKGGQKTGAAGGDMFSREYTDK